MADRRVFSNDPRNNYGTHFDSSPLTVSKVVNYDCKPIYGGRFLGKFNNFIVLITTIGCRASNSQPTLLLGCQRKSRKVSQEILSSSRRSQATTCVSFL